MDQQLSLLILEEEWSLVPSTHNLVQLSVTPVPEDLMVSPPCCICSQNIHTYVNLGF